MDREFKDYYRVLGVASDADEAAIKQAYRALARRHHPDVNPGNTAAEDRFEAIAVTQLALTLFGYLKGWFTGISPVRSALQTVLIGGLAAAVAFGIARAIS